MKVESKAIERLVNPKSKVKHTISERKVVVFSPSKILKNKLNGKQ